MLTVIIPEKLPTASQTAKTLVEQVFRLNGIPMEIVSDKRLQFVSQVWKRFCTALGAKVISQFGISPLG